jgi:WD40 repeat protein
MPHITLEPSSFTLDGHRESVNAVKFDADISMLLSGDDSGHIIVWDLGSHEALQTIDASFAGSVTALCWINVFKDGTAGETPSESPSPAFAVGFGTGIIAIYKQSMENVRRFLLT